MTAFARAPVLPWPPLKARSLLIVMNGARNLAGGHVRAAFRLERADVAVVLSGEIEKRAALRQAVARLGEVPVVFLQLFAAGADIDVGFGVVDKVAAGKGS